MNTTSAATVTGTPMYLPGLIRQTEDNDAPFAGIQRDQYLNWIAALSDLLLGASGRAHHQVADATIPDAAYLLYELTRTVQAFDEAEQRSKEAA